MSDYKLYNEDPVPGSVRAVSITIRVAPLTEGTK